MHTLAFTFAAARRRAMPGLLALCTSVLLSTAAHAEDDIIAANNKDIPGGPSLQFVGTETGSWESNPLMLIDGAKPLYGSITTPEVIFNGKTPTSLLKVDGLVNENLFNQETFDSTDAHGKVSFAEQMQRWNFQILQTSDYDTTRTSEIFPTALNGSIQNVPVRHLGLSLAPQISYSPTQIDKVTLSGSVLDSQYENPIFSNYGQAILTPAYQHNFDPLNAGTFDVQFQRYQSTSGPRVTSDSVAPQIGWIADLTPRLTAKVTGGVQASRQYGPDAVQVPWTLQYVFSADVGFKGQQDTTHFSAARTDYPFGNGTDSLLTTYTITEDHKINPLLSVNAGASYQTATYQSATPGGLDYLVTGTGGLTFHATERLDIAATYQYRRETLISTPGNAQDNMVTLGFVYRPQAWGL